MSRIRNSENLPVKHHSPLDRDFEKWKPKVFRDGLNVPLRKPINIERSRKPYLDTKTEIVSESDSSSGEESKGKEKVPKEETSPLLYDITQNKEVIELINILVNNLQTSEERRKELAEQFHKLFGKLMNVFSEQILKMLLESHEIN